MKLDSYQPPRLLRNGHVNSIISSTLPRRLKLPPHCRSFAKNARAQILQLDENVRLQVFYNLHRQVTEHNQQSIVIFLHGWEGCADSLYVQDLASCLHTQGYDVARLNFRDHGNTHHLNSELFHSCRLNEVRDAIGMIQQQCNKSSVILIGFSLGGNFALRVSAEPRTINLSKTFSICAVIDPEETLRAIESGSPVYRHYFLRRWKESLRIKAKHFPQRYQYKDIKPLTSLRELTCMLVERHTQFDSLQDYLQGYAIGGDRLDSIQHSSYLLFAKDDPIIPHIDINKLSSNPLLRIDLTQYGGHCGYLDKGLRFNWLLKYIEHYLAPPSKST